MELLRGTIALHPFRLLFLFFCSFLTKAMDFNGNALKGPIWESPATVS